MADNTVYTTVGKAQVVDRLDATSTVFMEFGEWGTGSTSDAVVGDTALQTEASEARVAVTKSQPAADKNQAVWTQTAAGTKTITEAGVNTLVSGTGVLIIRRATFTGVALLAGDSITFTASLQQT